MGFVNSSGEVFEAGLLYDVAKGDTTKELIEAVQAMRFDGWRTVGGVSVSVWIEQWQDYRKGGIESETHFMYCQAMEKTVHERVSPEAA